jgi:hypothetical protein
MRPSSLAVHVAASRSPSTLAIASQVRATLGGGEPRWLMNHERLGHGEPDERQNPVMVMGPRSSAPAKRSFDSLQ